MVAVLNLLSWPEPSGPFSCGARPVSTRRTDGRWQGARTGGARQGTGWGVHGVIQGVTMGGMWHGVIRH